MNTESVLARTRDALGGRSLAAIRCISRSGVQRYKVGEYQFCGYWNAWTNADAFFRQDLFMVGDAYNDVAATGELESSWSAATDARATPLDEAQWSDLRREAVAFSHAWLLDKDWLSTELVGEDERTFTMHIEVANSGVMDVFVSKRDFLPRKFLLERRAPSASQRLLASHQTFRRLVGQTNLLTASAKVADQLVFSHWQECRGVLFPRCITRSGSESAVNVTNDIELGSDDPRIYVEPATRDVPHFEFPPGVTRIDLPLEVANGLPCVRVRLQGRTDDLLFALDSGASVTIFNEATAQRLGVDTHCSFKNQTGAGAGSTVMNLAAGVEFEIAGLAYRNHTVLVSDLGPISHQMVGEPLDGVFGTTFFRHLTVSIDFAKSTVTFEDPHGFEPNSRAVPIEVDLSKGGVPIAKAEIVTGDRKLPFRVSIDTGTIACQGLLNRGFIEANDLDPVISPTVSCELFGLGGAVPMTVGRVDSIRLGGYQVEQPIVGLDQLGEGATGSSATCDGFVGSRFLHGCRLTLDYRRGRILIAQEEADHKCEFNMSGLSIVAASGFAGFDVKAVASGSPAEAANIRLEDRITQVDGQPASELALGELIDKLSTAGESTLSLGSDDASTHDCVLALRPLI